MTFLLAALFPLALSPDSSPPTSAELCGRCHRAIHESWKKSAHAEAMESRLFQDALELAEQEGGADARRICLGCHAPLAQPIGDAGLVRKVSWEGVTCDYCHSMREVSFGGGNPKAVLTFAAVKSGPRKDSVSTAHATVYSSVHSNSAVCAPCHEYRNALGFPVLTTYSEWQNSSYGKEGAQCQSCHMAKVAGDIVEPRAGVSHSGKINLHEMPGSHSLAQLISAVGAQLSALRQGDQLRVTVEVANRTTGHYLPTGSPLRQLNMELRVDSYSGKHFREERTYTRKVADSKGELIRREHAAFLRAAKVVEDTRLAPGEKRSEVFTFPIAAKDQTRIKVTFWYYYSPMATKESQERVTFLTLSRLVR